MTKFKLKVGNFIDVPVHLRVRDGGVIRDFKFTLVGKRISAMEAHELLSADGARSDTTLREFLLANFTDWRGQALVVDEDDAPLPFSTEAFEAMLGVAGAAGVICSAYWRELAAMDGAEGRRKN